MLGLRDEGLCCGEVWFLGRRIERGLEGHICRLLRNFMQAAFLKHLRFFLASLPWPGGAAGGRCGDQGGLFQADPILLHLA